MANPVTMDQFLDTLEMMLASQLRAVRSMRRGKRRKTAAADPGRRTSNLAIVEDVLVAAGGPLHVAEIIVRAKRDHGRTLNRDSIVSALTKKVLDRQTFARTGPNVFGLLPKGEDEP